MNDSLAIVDYGIVSALGSSRREVAKRLLRGDSGIRSNGAGKHLEPKVARIRRPIKTIDPRRWPIGRDTALALEAMRSVFPDMDAVAPQPKPRLGVIHATVYGNLNSLFTYLSDIKRYGLHRASPMQFPNTILHAGASFLSVGSGAQAFNIPITSGGLSGFDAIEAARQLLSVGAADEILVVASDGASPEVLSVLQASDELDWRFPDPFGHKRGGYVPGEAAVALLVQTESKARESKRTIHALLRGYSGCFRRPVSSRRNKEAMEACLQDANLQSSDVGCILASANGSRSDAAEADAIAKLFGDKICVTSIKAALGECGPSSSLVSLGAMIACAANGQYPPTLGRSKYDPILRPINLLRARAKMKNPIFLVNSFGNYLAGCQMWELASWKGRA